MADKWKYALIVAVVLLMFSCQAPQIEITAIKGFPDNSKRGLFFAEDGSVWSSGTNGVVFKKSTKHDWIIQEDTNLAALDFRDIHAFNENEALIMSSGDGCKIYSTSNGGEEWKLVYENLGEGIFFDGMDFWDEKNGIAFGDPINGKLQIISTSDGGKTWTSLENLPNTIKGEAGFAASGTGIVCIGDQKVIIGTGGGDFARVFISEDRGNTWNVYKTPMRAGEASGIYAMTFWDENNGVVVGGNYLDSAAVKGNCAITSDGGKTWLLPDTPPSGYRSCVAHNGDGVLIATGRTGVDVSFDAGMNWQFVSKDAYYSCVLKNNQGWMTGKEGKLARINLN